MIEDTIKAVKEAEKQASQIAADAEVKANELLKKAYSDA